MHDHEIHSDACERVFAAAERLFAQHGYTAVTLRDIAADVGIRHASLYHHVPGGKEQLFIVVTERTLARHRQRLTHIIAETRPDIRAQLHAIADWLLSQPPMDLVRMIHSDMPAIDPVHAERLGRMAYEAMIVPIIQALQQAQQRGEIDHHNLGLIGGGILGIIESLHAVPIYAITQSRQQMAYELIDALIDGIGCRDRSVAPECSTSKHQ